MNDWVNGGTNKGDGKKQCGFGWKDVEFEEQIGYSVEAWERLSWLEPWSLHVGMGKESHPVGSLTWIWQREGSSMWLQKGPMKGIGWLAHFA